MQKTGRGYEIDLVLRNNITTEEHRLGLYHPYADKHNIKKENIGVIEVVGLAVLSDAGVYKDTKEGREAFLKFLKTTGIVNK